MLFSALVLIISGIIITVKITLIFDVAPPDSVKIPVESCMRHKIYVCYLEGANITCVHVLKFKFTLKKYSVQNNKKRSRMNLSSMRTSFKAYIERSRC